MKFYNELKSDRLISLWGDLAPDQTIILSERPDIVAIIYNKINDYIIQDSRMTRNNLLRLKTLLIDDFNILKSYNAHLFETEDQPEIHGFRVIACEHMGILDFYCTEKETYIEIYSTDNHRIRL